MKSLTELFSGDDESSAVSTTSQPDQKIIRCSRCGTKYVVAGEIHDYICPTCYTYRSMNPDTLTSSAWNWAKFYTKRKKKISSTVPATPFRPDRQDKIRDQT